MPTTTVQRSRSGTRAPDSAQQHSQRRHDGAATAAVAVVLGIVGVAVGVGIGLRHLQVAGISATAAAGLLALVAGLVATVAGAQR